MSSPRFRRGARQPRSVAATAVLVLVLAGCGSSSVVPSASSQTLAVTPSPSAATTAGPSPSPSASPTPTATPSPSPTPSPTPLPPLAVTHCTGKSGHPSSTSVSSSDKLFAGYADAGTSRTVTCVEAAWVMPTITCAAGDSKSDMSVVVMIAGTDGRGTTSAHMRPEKAAAEAYCYDGIEQYVAWTYSVQPKDAGFKEAPFVIRAGDQMWGKVTASGHNFKMSIADLTNRQITTVSATVKDATVAEAQWVIESSEMGCPKKCVPSPLAKFDAVHFSGAQAVIGGSLQTVDRWPRESFWMGSGSTRRAVVSKAGRGAFIVTWKHK